MAQDKPVTLAAITGAHGVTGEVRLKLFGEGVAALSRYSSFNDGALTLRKLRDDAKGGALAQAPAKPETLTQIEARDLRDLMDDCGVDTATLCRHFGIDKVADLPRELLATARKDCENYRDNREAAKRHG